MDSNKINKLRIAANQFYLNKYMDQPIMDDAEYDPLKDEYIAEGGSILNLVEWDEDMKRTHTPLPKVSKTQVSDNKLGFAVDKYIRDHCILRELCHLNYKYDGSSIIAYYNEQGQLYRILGTPDQELCVDRTRNCFNMFPHQVTPGIECIQGEFLVDAQVYGQKARNKANGLLNSKDMIDDLENEGFIRVYQMRFYDGNWSITRLRKELNLLPVMARDRVRPVLFNGGIRNTSSFDAYFAPAPDITAPKESIITEGPIEIDEGLYTDRVDFQVDGVVLYHRDGYYAFKFYFTESAIVTVKEVEWNRQDNGGWMPKIKFDTIILNDKRIAKASSGGVPNMVNMKMGVGAKVRIILANMTIPKIVEVIEPSEDYQWPVCECGYQTSYDDVIGSTIKCHSEKCCTKIRMFGNDLSRWIKDNDQECDPKKFICDNIFKALNIATQVDRFDFSAKLIYRMQEDNGNYDFVNDIISACEKDDLQAYKDTLYKHFSFSSSTRAVFEANVGSAFEVIKQYLK